MKKILLTVLILGLVAVGVSGCTQEKLPAPKESASTVETPAQEGVPDLGTSPVSGSVASAVQSSTQTVIREGNTIVGGVAASTQSSTQDEVRESGTITSGVTSAALSSSQASAPEKGVLAEEAKTV